MNGGGMMDFDGSLVAALVAGATGVMSAAVGYGRNIERTKRLEVVVQELGSTVKTNKIENTDRLARIETKLDLLQEIRDDIRRLNNQRQQH